MRPHRVQLFTSNTSVQGIRDVSTGCRLLPVVPDKRHSSQPVSVSQRCQRATSTRSRSVRSGGRDRKLKESTASVAIDGSKFKAVNNRDRNFTRAKVERRRAQLEESVARYLSQLDTADRQGRFLTDQPDQPDQHFGKRGRNLGDWRPFSFGWSGEYLSGSSDLKISI
jgi:hypothetical protein